MTRRISLRLLVPLVLPLQSPAFETGRAEYSVWVNDLTIPYREFAIYALPGETLDIGIQGSDKLEGYTLDVATGSLIQAPGAWAWKAPNEPGLARLRIDNASDGILLNIFIMHPAGDVSNGRLNGFRIGEYPNEPLDGNPIYLPPDGFVELNLQNRDVRLSPHFQLSQFPSKQPGDFPKFLVLREQLFLKLELLLEYVNANGIEADTFTIMSGYRTPYYNAAIGNVPYSRHVFGGAADIFIDIDPVDDWMDDLNGDSERDFRDAQFLYQFADRLFSDDVNRALRGGLGVYARTSAHGPFLHVDARARRARWGMLP